MKVSVVKVLVLCALFVMTFLLGILPIILEKIFRKKADTESHKSKYKTILSCLSCFAAGVFLGTGVLDLLPSVRVDIGTTLNSLEVFTSFPVAEFVMMFGLFVILIVEQIVLTIKEKHADELSVRTPLLPSKDVTRSYSHSVTSEQSVIGGISDEPFTSSFPGVGTRRHCDSCEERVSRSNSVIEEDENHHHDEDDILPEHEHSSLRSILLLTALSLHSIFEGLAVGLQNKADDVIGIFAALVIHKSILSFCLGMNLIQSKLSHVGMIRSIVFFSLTAPIGIGVGIGIIDLWDSKSSLLVQGILTGIACGTFLYVTFFEVLPSEFNTHEHRLLKVLFLILGFATVSGVLFLHKEDGPTCFVLPPAAGKD
ncbi:zinc transporter ZIP1-like [Mercenaria mercenaria]|uniref:zinc transporter ZIP1-like n=1 Tax=Mercenaria mercenaria TaxID=6596 RepID=UPI00234F81D3|nr:zinc transporter ZIP1-like [Mercenaria mercenaria]